MTRTRRSKILDRIAALPVWLVRGLALGFAVLAVLAGFSLTGRDLRHRASCKSNLVFLARSVYFYAEASDGHLPVADGDHPAAHESANVLVDFFGSGTSLPPKLFVCPASAEGPAAMDENGKYQLDESTCSYAWTRHRGPLASSEVIPVASDKVFLTEKGGWWSRGRGHVGGVNIVYSDGSVDFVFMEEFDPEMDLPEGLAR